mmetsp:Transcript_65758/g.147772  ORF Transcript_65758/g.147772 Transcript_65758/m.147772 type:complete len:236 (+) Transcript_65758:215-922(+)
MQGHGLNPSAPGSAFAPVVKFVALVKFVAFAPTSSGSGVVLLVIGFTAPTETGISGRPIVQLFGIDVVVDVLLLSSNASLSPTSGARVLDELCLPVAGPVADPPPAVVVTPLCLVVEALRERPGLVELGDLVLYGVSSSSSVSLPSGVRVVEEIKLPLSGRVRDPPPMLVVTSLCLVTEATLEVPGIAEVDVASEVAPSASTSTPPGVPVLDDTVSSELSSSSFASLPSGVRVLD